MNPQPSEQGIPNPELNTSNESDVFATLRHLVGRIDTEDRMQEVIDRARGLQPRDIQLLVDCLSMALDKNAAPFKNRLHVWRSLIQVASSVKVFARNHTLRIDGITSNKESSPDAYRISGEQSVPVRALKRTRNGIDGYSEPHIGWVHLFHPNIISLYAAFLEGDHEPTLMYPHTTGRNVCDYIRELPRVPRMPLIFDIVSGLFYIHQFDIVHGGLYPQSILISGDGRASIASLDITPESQDSPVRYLAPEILEDDDVQPTKATDMWSFACICYEVLSGKIPFYQFMQERKLLFAIAKGDKPIRPGGAGHSANEVDDTIWQLLLMCWEFRPPDRPPCLKVHQIFLGMGIQDDRPTVKSIIGPDALMGSTIDLGHARTSLTTVLGSDHASSLRVPEDIRESLLRLIPDTVKLEAIATVAKKLSPDDTQCLVNFLDLVLEDLPDWMNPQRGAVQTLLSILMMTTRTIPRRYILNGVQYDSHGIITEGSFGKAYKGRGLSVRVNVLTNLSVVRRILRSMSDWSRSSHPNVVPFLGVFHEGINQSWQLCVVTPSWDNGNLRDYAPTLPQEGRMSLISDVCDGLNYIQGLGWVFGTRPITPEKVLISDQGRASLAFFDTFRIFTEFGATASTYEVRFTAPDVDRDALDDIWSFGCLCYEVLSRKPPYYQYTEATQIMSAVSRGELPKRPDYTDNDIDKIDDEAWGLIMRCCRHDRWFRPYVSEVQELISGMVFEDDRPQAECLPILHFLALRSRLDVNFPRVEVLLDKIQAELLRGPLSRLVQSGIKDVAAAVTEFNPEDIRAFVDFLDLALKDHLSISEERNRILALLSRVTSSTRIFPQRFSVKGIKYRPAPFAEGGFGTVHQGLELNTCVKVMGRVDPKALTEWIKELILWAHSSHPNVLPFYGVFLESVGDSQRICLVSPLMKNGNLHDFALRLSQKTRLPLISDVANGLQYIHGLGIVHSDLKGQNVLISDEGRGLITDFGASHVVTATAAATSSSIYSTLRFSAPEVILRGARWQPTKESDIWSFGCLCYQVLSRRVPYHEYKLDIQVSVALARKELPKRPGSTGQSDDDETSEDEWDDDYLDEDWDIIDDQAWNLITRCCVPEPEDRLNMPAIQELIADMKVWDERPPMKIAPGAEIFKSKLDPEIDLLRAGELLDMLQERVAPSEAGPQHDFIGGVFNNL